MGRSWIKRLRQKDEEILKGNDTYQGEQEYAIRKRSRDEFHKEIDDQLGRREHRLTHAVKITDTSMQLELVAVPVETAVTKFFQLEGKDAERMRGRSRITFRRKTKRLLRGIEEDAEHADKMTRVKWLSSVVECSDRVQKGWAIRFDLI